MSIKIKKGDLIFWQASGSPVWRGIVVDAKLPLVYWLSRGSESIKGAREEAVREGFFEESRTSVYRKGEKIN